MAILGIDISKANFHAFLIDGDREAKKSFANGAAGFRQLESWLKNRGAGEIWACMEATGSYWEALALHLHEAGHRVSVVNPSRTKAYARSEMLRAKTDPVDAAMIARFALAHKPAAWQPPPAETRMLQGLVRQLDHLKATKAEETVRLQTPQLPGLVQTSIEEVITTLDSQIREIEKALDDHIDRHPDLKRQRELLVSIDGIGDTTAALIIGEIPTIGLFESSRAVSAYAGLSPRTLQSGSSVWGRGALCKTGNSRLRKAMYFPALTAMRCNPLIKPFVERLSQRGKPRMVIVGAVMRKLLVLAYGVLKSGRHFDPSFSVPAA